MKQIGTYAPDFEIPGVDDTVHHFARYFDRYRVVCVVFASNHCPFVRRYLDRLKQLQADFEPEGATLLGINANDADRVPEDDFDTMKTFAREADLNFPYLWDSTQDVAQCFQAEKTPQAFVVDGDWRLRYIGAIDDSPDDPEAVTHNYLRDAIAAVLAGQPVEPAVTEPVGCSVKWRSA